MVTQFYDMCHQIWGGCPAVESIDSGKCNYCTVSSSDNV